MPTLFFRSAAGRVTGLQFEDVVGLVAGRARAVLGVVFLDHDGILGLDGRVIKCEVIEYEVRILVGQTEMTQDGHSQRVHRSDYIEGARLDVGVDEVATRVIKTERNSSVGVLATHRYVERSWRCE